MARRDPALRDTRERILAAALEVFGEVGYVTASLEDVAARAGLTKGAVYYWFRDKGDLAADLQRQLLERLRRRTAEAYSPDDSTRTVLKRSFEAFLDGLQDVGEARFLLRDSWAIPDLDVGGRAAHEAAVDDVRALLERGMRRGDIAAGDAEAAARVILGAFAEATLYMLTTERRADAVVAVHRVIDAFSTPSKEIGLAGRVQGEARQRQKLEV